jgi:hypothetical protein
MARPVTFPEANAVLTGSPEDRAAGTVLDLPIHRCRDLDGAHHVVSCWELDNEEWAEVARTGRIWLTSWGQTHPPIAVAGARATLFPDAA